MADKWFQCPAKGGSMSHLRCDLPDGHYGDHRFLDYDLMFRPIYPERATLMRLLDAIEALGDGSLMAGREWIAFPTDGWEAVKIEAASLSHVRLPKVDSGEEKS